MSDARLREFERRWRTTGDAEDLEAYARELERTGEGEEAWLLRVDHGLDPTTLDERLAEGAITLERLRFAAYLGSPPAQTLVRRERSADRPIRDVTDGRPVAEWWRFLQREFSSSFTDNALVELAREVLPLYERARPNREARPEDDRLQRALEAAQRRLSERPWDTRNQVVEAAALAKDAEEEAGEGTAALVAGVVLCATGALGGGPAPGGEATWEGQPYYAPWRKTIVLLEQIFGSPGLVRALRLALLPWALGEAPYRLPEP